MEVQRVVINSHIHMDMKIFYVRMRNVFTMIEGLKTAMYVGKRLVWDWKNLVDGNLEFSDNDLVPTRMDDEYIEFCKIKLNIRALIYQNCRIDDLIVGWDELSKKFDLVRVLA
jgi:hypothetical protein